MAQILAHPSSVALVAEMALAAENRNAAKSTFEINAHGSITYRDDGSLEYRKACELEAARAVALEWAVAFSEGWRSGRIVFSDDGVQLMNHIASLIAKTEKLKGE